MIPSDTPLVLCVRCRACGATPGRVCKEFGVKLIAHPVRLEAAQDVFDEMAEKLRAGIAARVAS